ncbi:MAG: xanthine dehydrogenase family protein molybdopterin-binding subunit [Anaerolineales bacterium]|jgi:CO/xanthine dehydrogenase Mo-binding subunit|nr:xanthine dehydrogenase family protein molybdopterin-binding subunit [Anaerolineales bacterium]
MSASVEYQGMAQWVGSSPERVGGRERVTGAQRYTGDIRLPGALHVKLAHLNCGHARILNVDASQALRLKGVVAVLTADDLPKPMPRFGPVYNDRPVIADDEVKYFGEPVAAVAAEDEDTALEAVKLLRIEYEELPGVYTIDEALRPGAPLVQHPSIRAADDPFRQSNILNEWRFGWGDVDQAQADLVIENVYRFPLVTHFPIENLAYQAAPEKDGVAVWSSIQHPYVLQRAIVTALNLPASKVRIIAPDPGGGFGGKGYPKYEPLLAFLALKTGRPVRLALTLEETFQAIRRAASQIRLRSGFTADGRLVFQDIEANYQLGAYADIGSRVVSKGSYVAAGPYHAPNVRIVGRAVLTHTTPSTAFRGFGIPQLSWALESQMDEAARQLGLDRLEIRLRNIPVKGETVIPGDKPVDGDWRMLLQRAANAIGWGQPLGKNRGRGLAIGMKNSASASASFAIGRLLQDGSLLILSSTSDMGQGARTIFSQLAADELGIPLDRISIVMGDTALAPFDASTSASRSSVFMGNAIISACRQIKAQLRQMAAEAYDMGEDCIRLQEGKVICGERAVAYDRLIRDYYGAVRGEVIAVGTARGKYLPNHPLGGQAAFWEVAAVGCEVEVDEETGEITIHKLVTVTDIGKALNPRQAEAQDEGAAIMGLGHTLMEHLILDEGGRIQNLGALDYRIPTIKDIPLEMETILQENGDGPGPYGSKGAGESGILAVSPAVGSAIREATGVTIHDLPLTPEKVWLALQEKRTGENSFARPLTDPKSYVE